MTRLTTIEEVLELEAEAKAQWMPGLSVREDKEDAWGEVVLTALISLGNGGTVTRKGLERAVRNQARNKARNKARDNERFESL